jgi:hypothetical protein
MMKGNINVISGKQAIMYLTSLYGARRMQHALQRKQLEKINGTFLSNFSLP